MVTTSLARGHIVAVFILNELAGKEESCVISFLPWYAGLASQVSPLCPFFLILIAMEFMEVTRGFTDKSNWRGCANCAERRIAVFIRILNSRGPIARQTA